MLVLRLLVRGLALALGGSAVLFGYTIAPAAWEQRSLSYIAHRIVSGDRYDSDVLRRALGQFRAGDARQCFPSSLRAAAIIELRLAEEAISAGNRKELDESLDSFRSSALRSLSCAPEDSFLWFALYWAEVTRRGFTPELLAYLRKSYELGPFEGWIQMKRNRLALAIYDQLPEDLAEAVLLEFKTLVNSGFTAEAAENLVGPGWSIRAKLVAPLNDVKMRYRRELFKEVRRAGYEVGVPGVEVDPRPWN